MADDELRGAVHWIDHFVVGTNDLVAWADWAVNATGVAPSPIRGVTTAARKRNQPFQCFLWWDDPSCRMGAFLQSEMYPPSKELGHDTHAPGLEPNSRFSSTYSPSDLHEMHMILLT